MKYYKFLTSAGDAPYAHTQWSLPTRNADGTWAPGDWMEPVEGELVLCENGYHICEPGDLVDWLDARLFEVEIAPGTDMIRDDVPPNSKTVVRSCRLVREVCAWNECTARLFAADCAEHVLALFERSYPNDNRPRQAIEVARRFAGGEATGRELAAASAPAWDAAWDAASAAARAAASAASDAASDASDAARDAARAASDAASAASDAAWDAEREWQVETLKRYLAAAPEQDGEG